MTTSFYYSLLADISNHELTPSRNRLAGCAMKMQAMFLALLIFLLASPAHSQATHWQWVKKPIGKGESQVKNIAVDAKGNTYAVGFFTEKLKPDTISLSSRGRSDLFVGKLSPNGKWEWIITAGSAESDQAAGIAMDAKGQIFITGAFSQQLQLGKTTLTSHGATDVFVAQLSPKGQWMWATSAGGVGADWPRAIAAGGSGNLVVAGLFAEEAFFGRSQVTSSGSTDAFVAQLTSAGTWQWVTAAGGSDNDAVNAVAVTNEGAVYVTGFFSNLASFGAIRLSGQGLDDAFVGKLSHTGQWQWATAGTSSNTAYGLSLTSDPTGGVYITGTFNGTALLGTHQLDSKGGDDGFVARVTDKGKWDWVTTLSGNYFVKISSILFTERGKLYVSGAFCDVIQGSAHQATSQGKTDILLGVLDKKGNWLSLSSTGGIEQDEAYSLALGAQGSILIGGWHEAGFIVGAVLP